MANSHRLILFAENGLNQQSRYEVRGGDANSSVSFWAFVVALQFAIGLPLSAHEGHQPLPTKGIQIDFARGHLTLSKQARDALGIAADEIQEATVSEEIHAYATVVSPWDARAFASARIAGRIASLNARPGDHVEKGQILAELSSREFELLDLAYEQALSEEKLSGEMLQITRPAATAGSIPAQRLIEAENLHSQNQNAVAILRIKASALGIDVASLDANAKSQIKFPIRAPIAGLVVHSDLAVGKFVDATEHLFEMVDNDRLWGRIQLLEQNTLTIRSGQAVQFEFIEAPNTSFPATVDLVGVSLDPKTRLGTCWSVLNNASRPASPSASRLVPGMVGHARIQIDSNPARLVVPQSAIYSDGLQRYVFVEEASTKESSEYQKRSVQIGRRKTTASKVPLVEIEDGDIFPGDRVVVRGGHELSSLFFLGVLRLDEPSRKRLGLQLETVGEHSISKTLALPASVVLPPQNKRTTSSQLAGSIQKIAVSPGQFVKVGDVLMELASSELQDLQLDLLRVHLDAELLRNKYQRLSNSNQDAVSRRILVETLSRAEQSEKRSASLQQQLRTIGFTEVDIRNIIDHRQIANSLPLRASIAGQVANLMAVLGESVAANQPLLEIHNLKEIWIEAYVAPIDAFRVATGSPAMIQLLASPDQALRATVSRLGPILDETNRIRSLWLVPSQAPPNRWFEEMLVTATIHLSASEPRKAVSNKAIVRDGLQSFVFVQTNQGTFERRRIVAGDSDDQLTEIKRGLEIGEQVVVSGVTQMQTAYASLR